MVTELGRDSLWWQLFSNVDKLWPNAFHCMVSTVVPGCSFSYTTKIFPLVKILMDNTPTFCGGYFQDFVAKWGV